MTALVFVDVALTEGIIDLAAQKLGIDPAEFRRKNMIPDDAYPYTGAADLKYEVLTHHRASTSCLRSWNTRRWGPSRQSCANKASIAASALRQ